MGVIGVGELILDDDYPAICHIPADQVQRVAADRTFGLSELKLDPQCFGEPVGIVEQPRREIQRPHASRPNADPPPRVDPAPSPHWSSGERPLERGCLLPVPWPTAPYHA